MATFDLSNRIRVLNPCSNIDHYYGPYESIEAAKTTLAGFMRSDASKELLKGRTIGIIEDNKVVEYWWQYIPAEGDQPAKYDFVLKTSATVTDLETITEPQIDDLFEDAYVEDMLKDLVPVFKDEFGNPIEPTEPSEPTE